MIGLAGNLGMYTMGVPVGMFVDHRGPRPAVIAGSILLGLGYFPLHQAYDSGSGSVPLLCLFSYMTGLGGCMAFAASVKTSALNWPRHRGTATAFPLAAFGLSAFFFSLFGSLFFPGNPSAFLMSLACGTFGLTFVGFFFLRVLPPPHHGHHHHRYLSVPGDAEGGMTDSQQLRRASSDEAKLRRAASHDRSAGMHSDIEPGMFYAQSSHRGTAAPASSTPSSSSAAPSTATRTATTTVQPQQPGPEAAAGDGRERRRVGEQQPPPAGGAPVDSSSNMQSACISATAAASGTGGQTASASSSVPPEQQPAKQPYTVRVYDGTAEEEEEEEEVQYVDDERTSLMSRSSSRSSSSDSDSDIDVVPLQSSIDMDRSHRVDYRGWKLLRQFEFWQLFSIMGILTGIGLMTIK